MAEHFMQNIGTSQEYLPGSTKIARTYKGRPVKI